jgi:hypothetical protein
MNPVGDAGILLSVCRRVSIRELLNIVRGSFNIKEEGYRGGYFVP